MKKLDEPTPENCIENKLVLDFDFDHESYEAIHQYVFGLNVDFKEENVLNYYEIVAFLEVENLEKIFRKEIFSEKFLNNEKWFEISIGVFSFFIQETIIF